MNRPVPFADAAATTSDIETAFQFYLGRKPAPHVAADLVQRQALVREVEAILIKSIEYRTKGPVLATYRRGRWDNAILLIDAARIVYNPIAKVGNTSVKHWALRLEGHGNQSDVHGILDQGTIKLQARYRSEQEFDRILKSPDWARVAILRDPFDRLVSCYWDKFVRGRSANSVLFHTRDVYRFLYGQDSPTADQISRGITFRQFCHYINLSPRDAMDSHWAPQSRYLETFRWTHLFRIDRIDTFERFVLERCDPRLQDIRLGLQNFVPRNETAFDRSAVDMWPDELDKYGKLPNSAFLTGDIEEFVRDYFSLDYVLLDRAQG